MSRAVKLLMYFPQLAIGDVGVDLRRRDARVSEHGLHRSDIRAVEEEVGRITVAHGVRGDVFRESRGMGILFNEPLDAPRGERTGFFFAVFIRSIVTHKERHFRIRAFVEIFFDPIL